MRRTLKDLDALKFLGQVKHSTLLSILNLGESVGSKDISSLIQKPSFPPKKKPAVGIIDFNLKERLISFDLNMIPSTTNVIEVAEKYRFVGNPKGNKPQWALSTANLGYLLTESISNLIKNLDSGSELRLKLSEIFETFFKNVTFKDGKKGIIVNPRMLAIPGFEAYSVDASLNLNFNKDEFLKALAENIIKRLSDRDTTFVFWTIRLNEEFLCTSDEYADAVLSIQEGESNDTGKSGICSICGKRNPVSYKDTTNLQFKYFITDKISFASNLEASGFISNMVICKSCYWKLLGAERYIKNSLQVSLGGYPVFLIPSLPGEVIERNDMNSLAEIVTHKFKTILNYNNLQELEDELANVSNESGIKGHYVLTILFPKKSARSDFKISEILEEIPLTRINNILSNLKKATQTYKNYFSVDETYGSTFQFSCSLQKSFYYLQPLTGFGNTDKKAALDLIASVFSGLPISQNVLLKMLMENLRQRQLRLGNDHSKNKAMDREKQDFSYRGFCRSIVETGIFVLFLNLDSLPIENLKGVEKMNEIENVEMSFVGKKVDEVVEKGEAFLSEAKYDPAQKGLFWLGYLSGKLMASQYKSLKKQPLLDKIGFKGMDKSALKQYDVELFESMKNYGLLGAPWIQHIHFLAHKYLDQYLNEVDEHIQREEVPYYILAGISYEYFTRPSKEKEQEEQEEGGEK